MTYQIEKNIPMLSARAASHNYPYGDMEVGDSFLVKTEGVNELSVSRRLRSSAYVYASKSGDGKKFTVRKVGDEGFRVWRVA